MSEVQSIYVPSMESQATAATARHDALPWLVANFTGAPMVNGEPCEFKAGGAIVTSFRHGTVKAGMWSLDAAAMEPIVYKLQKLKLPVAFKGMPAGTVFMRRGIECVHESRYRPKLSVLEPVFVCDAEDKIRLWLAFEVLFHGNIRSVDLPRTAGGCCHGTAHPATVRSYNEWRAGLAALVGRDEKEAYEREEDRMIATRRYDPMRSSGFDRLYRNAGQPTMS